MKRENTGITLVALVVTIIILLILAGITIVQLVNNGIFTKANQAQEKYEQEEILEYLEIARFTIIEESGKTDLEKYCEYVQIDGSIGKYKVTNISYGEEETRYIMIDEKYLYKVQQEENDIIINIISPTSSDYIEEKLKSSIGKKVNYTGSEAINSVDWNLFMRDDRNIYIIAADYIENNYVDFPYYEGNKSRTIFGKLPWYNYCGGGS